MCSAYLRGGKMIMTWVKKWGFMSGREKRLQIGVTWRLPLSFGVREAGKFK